MLTSVHGSHYDGGNNTQTNDTPDPFALTRNVDNLGWTEMSLAVVPFTEWSIVHGTGPCVLIALVLRR